MKNKHLLAFVLAIGIANATLSVPAFAQIYGTLESGMTYDGGSGWNYSLSFMDDYSSGVNREWWSCGDVSGGMHPYICYGEYNSYVNRDIYGPSYGLCDVSDPTVVKFNGQYYLYLTGIRSGNDGCPGGSEAGDNGNIYAFMSADARTWSILNGGNPVISQADTNPPAYGIGQPSAIVMSYTYSCLGGFWQATPTTPWIRVYYTWTDPGTPVPGYHMFASDSTDAVTFVYHNLRGLGSPTPILSSGSGISSGGWYPGVKKVGLFGDYPLVLAYANGVSGTSTAVTGVTPSDFSWFGGNGGNPTPLSPAPQQTRLDGDQTGLFLNTSGAAFSGSPSGQNNFWWSQQLSSPPYLYVGPGNTSTYFPWGTVGGSCE